MCTFKDLLELYEENMHAKTSEWAQAIATDVLFIHIACEMMYHHTHALSYHDNYSVRIAPFYQKFTLTGITFRLFPWCPFYSRKTIFSFMEQSIVILLATFRDPINSNQKWLWLLSIDSIDFQCIHSFTMVLFMTNVGVDPFHFNVNVPDVPTRL